MYESYKSAGISILNELVVDKGWVNVIKESFEKIPQDRKQLADNPHCELMKKLGAISDFYQTELESVGFQNVYVTIKEKKAVRREVYETDRFFKNIQECGHDGFVKTYYMTIPAEKSSNH